MVIYVQDSHWQPQLNTMMDWKIQVFTRPALILFRQSSGGEDLPNDRFPILVYIVYWPSIFSIYNVLGECEVIGHSSKILPRPGLH